MKTVPTTFKPVNSKTFKQSQLPMKKSIFGTGFLIITCNTMQREKQRRFMFTISTVVPDPLLLWNALLAS